MSKSKKSEAARSQGGASRRCNIILYCAPLPRVSRHGWDGHAPVKNTYKESMRSEGILIQFGVVLYYLTTLVYPHPSRLNLDYDFPHQKHLIQVVTLQGTWS